MWWRPRHDPRVRDELRFHRDRLIEDYMAAGMDRQSAARKAFIEFGSMPGLEEQIRDVRGRWLEDVFQDLRYAIRTLRRTPGFAAVAILSLSLSIGANAAIFSLINGILLRAMPVGSPDRLVALARIGPGGQRLSVPFQFFDLLRARMTSVSGVTAVGTTDQTAMIDGEDELVSVDMVSGSYFDVLQVRPTLGRALAPADDTAATGALAAMVSDGFWRRRFDASPSAIGRTIAFGDRLFTIVGVTPPAFHSIQRGRTPDVMVPLQTMMPGEWRQADLNNIMVLARLAPGRTVAHANAEVQTLYGGFAQMQAARVREKDRHFFLGQRAGAVPAPDGFNPFRDTYGQSLLILMGSVGLVLLLACVNLSGLLLARAASRQREIAIRLAIGAGRGRLTRQFLVESLVLAVFGAGIGLLMAGPVASRLLALFLNGRNFAASVSPDWRVVGFTAAIAIAACVLAGLAPALHAARAAVNPALKEVRARGTGRLGKGLVVAQLAISMVLLVGATLFIGTLIELQTVDRGFDASGLLVVNVRAVAEYSASRSPFVARALVERFGALPGVQTASATDILPLGGSLWARTIQVEGHQFGVNEDDSAGFNDVAPGYFAAMRTPFVTGRDFDAHDTASSPKVAIVNTSFARDFFRDGAAVGRHVSSNGVSYEIVGVVADAKYRRLRDAVLRTVYVPWTQRQGNDPSSYSYLLRVASGDPQRLIPDLPRAVLDTDPALRVRRARLYTSVIDESIGGERTMATLGAAFGGLALLVAALGVFGLLAFQVTRRTNEIAVRLALGASRGRLMRQVLRDVGALALAGVTLGAGAAFFASGVVRALLFGVTPTEPAVFIVAGCVLAAVAAGAGWLPARRASRVDPLIALRHE